MKRLLAILSAAIPLVGCSDGGDKRPPTPVVGTQLYANATFTNWPNGNPVRGAFGGGKETADHWMTKWNQNAASSVVASKTTTAGGITYNMTPAPGVVWDNPAAGNGETYYLRQTYPSLKASLGHKFRASYSVRARTPGVRGGFYVNAWWNNNDRLPIANTATQLPLPVTADCVVYSIDFTMPAGAPAAWKLEDSQGVEATFLMTTDHPAVVDVCAGTLVMIQ